MDALRSSYAISSDSDSDSDTGDTESGDTAAAAVVFAGSQSSGGGDGDGDGVSYRPCGGDSAPVSLPPPPLHLLDLPGRCENSHGGRVRNFPHVEGNFALHVYIPVVIPFAIRKELAPVIKRVSSTVPGLLVVDADIPLSDICRDVQRLEQVVLGREFHISLGRTVPIRVHQIESIVLMLRQKLQSQKGYLIDFSKWEAFINDDQTRTFLSLEITARGLTEITKHISIVNIVYRLHNLPEFYENPRPHISLAWALGDISHSLNRAVDELNGHHAYPTQTHKQIFWTKFGGIQCKVGKTLHEICKIYCL